VRLAICQMNATVGDIAGNARRIHAGIEQARAAGAALVLFPELALTGYPPEDLLLREHFLDDARTALEELAVHIPEITAIVGFPARVPETARQLGAQASTSAGQPWRAPDAERPEVETEQETEEFIGTPATPLVNNAAAVLSSGAVRSIYRKVHLPNYGVFDEQRYFTAGERGAVIEVGGHPVGLTVCEDLWWSGPPAAEEARAGAKLILNISASPYHAGKGLERERLFAQRAREHRTHIVFCGLVGGQDELLFDGHSFVLDPTGATIARAAQFEEELLVCDLDLDCDPVSARAPAHATSAAPHTPALALPSPTDRQALASPTASTPAHAAAPERPLSAPLAPVEAEIYAALCLGLRDYVHKNGFTHVVLGLSGGIDSALVGCLAADALGAERVSAAIMPSPFSSAATQDDARALAATLGVRTHELPIEAAMDAYAETLREQLAGGAGGRLSGRADGQPDLTMENLQARIRGNLLMALSNEFGWLVLTTGNKSEMSVGYTTLYGDLAGGFAVIKDVPKTLVYRLCEWRNSPASGDTVPIPPSIIARAPSAELREGQLDADSLPPYPLLDRILHGYIELDRSREQLIAEGLPSAEVDRTIRLVDLAEYKRRQAPPGIKITTRAFGRDRRMPITNRYRG
jgi:NAD+ synthase (glutamine-hydrolysing)